MGKISNNKLLYHQSSAFSTLTHSEELLLIMAEDEKEATRLAKEYINRFAYLQETDDWRVERWHAGKVKMDDQSSRSLSLFGCAEVQLR